jgi:hypothetical protein
LNKITLARLGPNWSFASHHAQLHILLEILERENGFDFYSADMADANRLVYNHIVKGATF